jgi:hypothetical protein
VGILTLKGSPIFSLYLRKTTTTEAAPLSALFGGREFRPLKLYDFVAAFDSAASAADSITADAAKAVLGRACRWKNIGDSEFDLRVCSKETIVRICMALATSHCTSARSNQDLMGQPQKRCTLRDADLRKLNVRG